MCERNVTITHSGLGEGPKEELQLGVPGKRWCEAGRAGWFGGWEEEMWGVLLGGGGKV